MDFSGRGPLDEVYGEPTLAEPVSQACTQSQIEDPLTDYWCSVMKIKPFMHRKLWEFVYILQALRVNDMLQEGKSGLGFGVGAEPLSSIFTSRGVNVLGTDLDPAGAEESGWISSEQYAAGKAQMNSWKLCEPEQFERLADFRFMNMNHIDANLAQKYDFCWSSCALEHLGSIKKGLEFIENSVACLKPGGIAVHTTEYNCLSNDGTLDNAGTVIFRKRDFEKLAKRLAHDGHAMVFNFGLGDQPADQHIDMAPYSQDPHLKLELENWTTTSFGILVRKAA